jgi:hypothetical protein
MVHGSAVLVLPLTGLSLMVTLAIALAVTGSFLRAWRTHVSLTRPAAIRQLRWGAGNDWQLTRQDGTAWRTCLQPRVLIHPQLVILRFRHSRWRTDSVVLTRDRLDPELFRRLRVRLLIEIKQLAVTSGS